VEILVITMNKFLLVLIALTAGIVSSGCGRPLVHPIDCDNMLHLRLGQSPGEVQTLLGPPAFAAPQVSAFGDGNYMTKTDTIWLYYPDSETLVGDVFSLDFFEQKLVRASAYRRYALGPHKRIVSAYHLDAHREPQPELGPAFESVFTCRPGFSRDEATNRDAKRQ
jgi:hypothetical protein